MTEPLDLARLAMFSRLMSHEQRARFYAAVERTGTADPALLMRVARHHRANGESERAMQTLLRVAAIHWMTDGVSKNDVEKLGREIAGDERWQIPEPDEPALQAAGYRHIVPGEPLEAQVGLNEPVLFYRQTDGRLERHAVVVEPSGADEGVFSLALFGLNGAIRSTRHGGQRPWHCRFTHSSADGTLSVQARETEVERFEVRVDLNHTTRGAERQPPINHRPDARPGSAWRWGSSRARTT